MFSESDHHWMQQAISLAKKAAKKNEVPVGAVLILNDQIIGEGANAPIASNDPTAHAEILALRAGAKAINNYRILDATLYVTLEPCMMCASAMVHARIKRLVYGASDPKAGVIQSKLPCLDQPFLNHRITHTGGLLAEECGQLLSQFFQERR